MNKRVKTGLVKYVSCGLVVVLLAVSYLSLRDFEGAELSEKFRMLCDALTIPGVILIMCGAMMWASTLGALDGVSYCVKTAVNALIPLKRLEKDEKYADYVERKSKNRATGYGFLFISGGVTMALSIVFMVLYYAFQA